MKQNTAGRACPFQLVRKPENPARREGRSLSRKPGRGAFYMCWSGRRGRRRDRQRTAHCLLPTEDIAGKIGLSRLQQRADRRRWNRTEIRVQNRLEETCEKVAAATGRRMPKTSGIGKILLRCGCGYGIMGRLMKSCPYSGRFDKGVKIPLQERR